MDAYRLFGIELRTDLDLPGHPVGGALGGIPAVTLAAAGALPGPAPDAPGAWHGEVDGQRLLAAHDKRGALLVQWGDVARFRFSGSLLEWCGGDPADPGWQRLLLDTVAYLVALEAGREALHAAGVAVAGRAIAIAGRTGAGKSTLTHALLQRGAALLSDDIVALELRDAVVVAHPGPGLMTVPAHLPVPGRPLAAPAGECWAEVPVADGPRPLAVVVLLDRREGLVLAADELAPNPLLVLPHFLAFPRTGSREARRFEMAGDLVSRVPVHRLKADTSTEPGRLAERVLQLVNEDEHGRRDT